MQPIELGRLRVTKGHEMDSPVPLLSQLPGTTATDMKRLLTWYDQPDEVNADPEASFMTFSVHSWVIEVDGQTILVDTCCGNDKPRLLPEVDHLGTDYLGNLRRAGFAPEDIDLVMCTHLHFDHTGWNTRLDNGRWVPTFPNARYIFSKEEYARFAPENRTADPPPFLDIFEDSVLPVIQSGQAEFISGEHQIQDLLTIIP